jgi:hypothetical protein
MILSSRFVPGSKKFSIIYPSILARNDKNMITYLKLEISRVVQKDVEFVFHPKDNNSLMAAEWEKEYLNVNEFLTIVDPKKLLIYRINTIRQ